jgi:uncharacterized protein (TIGR02099 family)
MSRFSSFGHKVLYFLAIFCLLVALVLSVARSLTPFFTSHKVWLSQIASSALGLPVEIGTVEASLVGITPGFSFTDVVVLSEDKQTAILKIHNAKLGINLWESLWQRKFISDSIYISGTKIVLEQNGEETRINGYILDSSKNSAIFKDGWLAPETIHIVNGLLSQHSIRLSHIAFEAYRNKKKEIDISDLNFSLHNKNNEHRLRTLTKTVIFNGAMRLDADFKGNVNQRESLSGRLYLNVNNQLLMSVLQTWLPLNFKTFKGKTEFWLDFERGELQSVQTKLAASDLELTLKPRPIKVAVLAGNLFWRKWGIDAWSLSSDQLSYQLGTKFFPVSDFSLVFDQRNLFQSFVWPHVNMDMVWNWIAVNGLPPQWVNLFSSVRPQGEVNNFKILHQGDWQTLLNSFDDPNIKTQKKSKQESAGVLSNLLSSLYVGAQFSNFSFNDPSLNFALSHLSGNLLFRPDGGEFIASTQNAILTSPQVFVGSLSGIQAMGALRWQKKQDQSWQINTDQFLLGNNLAKFTTSFSLDLPKRHSGATINLLSVFDQYDSAEIKNLLPRKVMDKGLVDWLDQAFLAGTGERGTLLMRGKLADFPYERHQGQFIAEAAIKDMTLHYADEWPVLSQLNGLLRFDPQGMFFNATSGTVINKSFEKIEAVIPRVFSDKIPGVLHVQSKIALKIPEALSFIKNSPLKKTLSGLSKLQGEGETQLDLGLKVPLSEENFDNIKVKGEIKFSEARILLPEWQLVINQLNGQLSFSEDTVSAANMQANLFNEPAKINIQTIKEPKDTITRFSVESVIGIPELKKQFNIPFLNSMTGKTVYQATLNLSTKSDLISLIVNSNLNGIKVDLPAPYGKAVTQALPFHLRAYFPPEGVNLFFDYENYVQARFFFKGEGSKESNFSKATLHLGAQNVPAEQLPLPKEEGVWVIGKISDFNWGAWKPTIEKYFMNHKPNQKNLKQLSFLVDLFVDKLNIFNQIIERSQVKVEPIDASGGVQISVDSPTMVGVVKIPSDFPKMSMVGDFSRLYFPPVKVDDSVMSTASKQNWKPNDLPPLNITVADLQVGPDKLGKVTLNVVPGATSQFLKLDISMASTALTADIKGYWKMLGKQHYTQIKATTKVSDLGSILKNFAVSERLLGARGDINFDLKWPDSPLNFNLKNLSGAANVNLKNGTIVGFDAATRSKLDAGKLLNALSVQSVFQRLGSGFSDVRHGGYGFTSWQGHYEFIPGRVQIKDTALDGSVGKIYLTGGIDTQNRTYNLVLKVVPQYTSSLGLLGFIGGPIVGVATMAANQIVSIGLDQVTGQNYTVTGSWDDPKVDKIK